MLMRCSAQRRKAYVFDIQISRYCESLENNTTAGITQRYKVDERGWLIFNVVDRIHHFALASFGKLQCKNKVEKWNKRKRTSNWKLLQLVISFFYSAVCPLVRCFLLVALSLPEEDQFCLLCWIIVTTSSLALLVFRFVLRGAFLRLWLIFMPLQEL